MSSVMSSAKGSWITVAALMAAAVGSQLTLATASADLHNVTYIARIDGVAPGGQAIFMISDHESNSVDLSSVPGKAFEANAVLADPAKAGMRVTIHWPYSASVHCEVDIDDNVAIQIDQLVTPQPPGPATDLANGVVACGGPVTNS